MKQRIESVFWKTIEKNHPGRGEKSNKKNEESLRNILDNMKRTTSISRKYQKEKRASKGSRTYLKK